MRADGQRRVSTERGRAEGQRRVVTDEPVTVNIETLLRRVGPTAFPLSAQEAVDELLSKNPEPLTSEQRKRFVAAAERALRARREILTLAAFACDHRPHTPPQTRRCRSCDETWPCPEVLRTAGPALDAVAELKG